MTLSGWCCLSGAAYVKRLIVLLTVPITRVTTASYLSIRCDDHVGADDDAGAVPIYNSDSEVSHHRYSGVNSICGIPFTLGETDPAGET